MRDLSMLWILTPFVLLPGGANAADEQAALLQKANIYAFEAKHYGAAGKPFTNIVAKRYANWSQYYRDRAAEVHSGR